MNDLILVVASGSGAVFLSTLTSTQCIQWEFRPLHISHSFYLAAYPNIVIIIISFPSSEYTQYPLMTKLKHIFMEMSAKYIDAHIQTLNFFT